MWRVCVTSESACGTKEEGPERPRAEECNTQPCAGDEIRMANQDVIIAIDGVCVCVHRVCDVFSSVLAAGTVGQAARSNMDVIHSCIAIPERRP